MNMTMSDRNQLNIRISTTPKRKTSDVAFRWTSMNMQGKLDSHCLIFRIPASWKTYSELGKMAAAFANDLVDMISRLETAGFKPCRREVATFR